MGLGDRQVAVKKTRTNKRTVKSAGGLAWVGRFRAQCWEERLA